MILEVYDLLLYGASGHAKVIIDIVEKIGDSKNIALIDDNSALIGKALNGYRIIGGPEKLPYLNKERLMVIVSIGDNQVRINLSNWLDQNNFRLASYIHPNACIANKVEIGAGTVIMAGVVINSNTKINNWVIINTKVSVDHDCLIGSGVHLAPGVTLCGGVEVGKGTFIGASCTVIPNIKIGENVFIPAGIVVYKNIANDTKICARTGRW